jgi:two-component system sensor histidine kinase EvgS
MAKKIICLHFFMVLALLFTTNIYARSSPALYSTMQMRHQDMQITVDDWNWLRQKRKLNIGVSNYEQPPFRVSYDDEHYEGLSADVIGLISQLLGVEIQIKNFPNDKEAYAALDDGTVDLLSAHNDSSNNYPVLLSKPFLQERLAIFKRVNDTREVSNDLSGLKTAVLREHLSALKNRYPKAHFVTYDSHDNAIAAVSSGRSDIYIDDITTAYYRINRSFYSLVKFERALDDVKASSYSFVLRWDNQHLLRLMDSAINSIGPDRLARASKRWVGSGLIPNNEPIKLTANESRWIARNPTVRLIINDGLAPIAFYTSDGVFAGLSSDLFDLISQRTGLKFEVSSHTGGFPEKVRTLLKNKADIAILISDEDDEEKLRYSRPILSNPYVLVVRADGSDKTRISSNLSGRRIAIGANHINPAKIRQAFPESSIVQTTTALEAMHLVQEGEAKAAIISLPTARYYTARWFHGHLAIADVLQIGMNTTKFAMRNSDSELESIINKVLIELPPDEMNALANRWRTLPNMSGRTWRNYEQMILEIVIAAAVLLLLSLVWVLYLRRQIGARERAEKALKDQLKFVETLTDSMPPPLYVRDRNGRLLSCNRSYLEGLGVTSEQVLHKTLIELPYEHIERKPEFHESYMKAIRTGQTIKAMIGVKVMGKSLWLDHWIRPYHDSNGEIQGVICGWIDITEHHKLISQLEVAKNQADEASRAKTTFLATMSHEIRTPMNAVIGILELVLKRTELTSNDRNSIEIAHTSARSLLDLIGDILDIARIESGRLSLSLKRANLRELVESVARVFEGLARQKHLVLNVDIDTSVNCDVLIDSIRFKQILSNLTSNAIKFTDEGSVHISISANKSDPTSMRVHMSVKDTGVGISNEDLQKLFHPFSQVNQNSNIREGAGLGLVICRSLCEMMGGSMVMTSEVGKGTCVDVNIRLQTLAPVAETEPKPLTQNQTARCLQVLVVDDHAVNREILRQQLIYLGHEVTEADNGSTALQLWREQPFDVVISDCRMPVMDGHDLTLAIRSEEAESNEEPTIILGLTADAQPEEIQRCIQAGMNDCLIKPIGLDVLETLLLNVNEAEGTSEHIEQHSSTELFSLESLKSLAGNKPGVFERLINELIKSNRNDLSAILEQFNTHSFAEIAEVAHRIKGAARIVRAESLFQHCERLELACTSDTISLADIEDCIKSVDAEISAQEEQLIAILENHKRTTS